ncbi:hypothetical protein N7540_008345 [Penicillium herquei]|nr:hypothetical protein N7540_008345 [Penicillium herquei]
MYLQMGSRLANRYGEVPKWAGGRSREVSKDDGGKEREDNRLNDMGMLGHKRQRLNLIGHCPTYTRAGGWRSLERPDEPRVKTTDM